MAEKLKGTIERVPSIMMTVPVNEENIKNPEFVYYNLQNAEDFTVKEIYYDKKTDNPVANIQYLGKNYRVDFFIEDFKLPRLYNLNHQISQNNIDLLMKNTLGITTVMTFSENIAESYQLQLKILNCMVPDSAGIIDFSAEKILSPVWVEMATKSSVPPALSYLFSVQAVSDEKNDSVWVHTHGLNRCGIIELEILGCNGSNYKKLCDMLVEMAMFAISNNNLPDEEQPIFVSRLENGDWVVNTWIDTKRAIKMFDKNIIGGKKDRKRGHDNLFGSVFNYPQYADYESRNFVKLSEVPEDIFQNSLVMITNEETERMSTLAKERFSFLKDAFQNNENTEGIAKVRLKVDEDKVKDAGCEYEHIWFGIIEVKEDTLVCQLNQEPFYIDNIHTDDIMEISVEDLTDWIMFTKGIRVTPDSCYLLVEDININN